MSSPYYAPPPPPRPRRSPAAWIIVAVVAGSVVLLALFAAAVAVVLRGDEREGPVADPVPFRLQPVLELSPPPCTSGTVASADGTACYRLAEGMTVRRVGDAQAGMLDSQQWGLRVSLEEADAAAFSRLTAELHSQPSPRNQLAIVVDGKVLSTPVISEPILGSRLEISGNFTQDSATELERRLQGRPGS
ncbi:hypothetical protein [Nonomuraea sp. NPDC049784]|uniref:SecDF P1 head subdomain-containing protein n=1 Tax=Nonomuraea sp. NPDC049784 TaxID=3154361 RepID=UPI0033D9F02B